MKSYKLPFTGYLMAAVKQETNGLIVIELEEPVDEALLFSSTEYALNMHPIFRTKLIKGFFKYELVPNDKPPVVKKIPWDEAVNYGTDEYNEFPWNISYTENKIVFVAAHFLTDGMGEFSFLKSVLRYYFEKRGIELPGEYGFIKDSDIVKTTHEPMSTTGIRKKIKTNIVLKVVKANLLPDDFYKTTQDGNYLSQFIIDRKDVSKTGKETDTSTFSVLCGIACKSVALAAGLSEGYVTANVAIDLRDRFKSITDLDFSETALLRYDIKKLIDKDAFLASTALRSQLDIWLDEDNLHNKIAQMNMLNGKLRGLFINLAKKGYHDMLYTKQASFVYSHMTRIPIPEELFSSVKSAYLTGTSTLSPLILFHGTTYKDKIYITLTESSRDNIIAKTFYEQLQEEGINVTHNMVPGHGFMRYTPKCWGYK